MALKTLMRTAVLVALALPAAARTAPSTTSHRAHQPAGAE
jgi:hypothetical protein